MAFYPTTSVYYTQNAPVVPLACLDNKRRNRRVLLSLEIVMKRVAPDDFTWYGEPSKQTNHSEQYTSYLNSPEWAVKRREAMHRARYTCERCGVHESGARRLQVHHKTYANLGNEPLDDLQVLCKPCHDVMDQQRKDARKD